MSDQPKEELHIQGGEQENLAEQASQESQPSEEQQPQQTKDEPKKSGGGFASIMSGPANMGNKAGDAIQSTVGKVGQPVGKGLETVTKPVGGVVGAVVDAPFKAGEMATGSGEHGADIKKQTAEAEKDEKTFEPKGGKRADWREPAGAVRNEAPSALAGYE